MSNLEQTLRHRPASKEIRRLWYSLYRGGDARPARDRFGEALGLKPGGVVMVIYRVVGIRICPDCGKIHRDRRVSRCKEHHLEASRIRQQKYNSTTLAAKKAPKRRFMTEEELWRYARSIGYTPEAYGEAHEDVRVNPRARFVYVYA